MASAKQRTPAIPAHYRPSEIVSLTPEERCQAAFENSPFYFNGESPTERILAWHVWRQAWDAAMAIK